MKTTFDIHNDWRSCICAQCEAYRINSAPEEATVCLIDVAPDLIAAAPELLAALKAAVEHSDHMLAKYFPGGRMPENQAIYDRCVAAIARAEGRADDETTD
jgi:hypothetical protein